MKEKIKKIGVFYIVPGLIIQLSGMFTADTIREPEVVFWANIAHLFGTIILLIGFVFYSKAKGRNVLWSLLAILSIVGVAIMFILKDLSIRPEKINEVV